MKLDYLDKINDRGDSIVRLYDFDFLQVEKLCQNIQHTIIKNKMSLDLTSIEFIQPLNCSLTLRIADNDTGITSQDKRNYFCDLTLKSYEEMILLLEPFCKIETKGYQWLFDLNTQTEFLFTLDGNW